MSTRAVPSITVTASLNWWIWYGRSAPGWNLAMPVLKAGGATCLGDEGLQAHAATMPYLRPHPAHARK